jgi:hypothetical protein
MVDNVTKFVKVLTLPAVMILLACLIIPACALPGGSTGFPGGKIGGNPMTAQLDQLEGQGYDISAIRAAVESGDRDTARTLLHQLMEEHRDEFPAPPDIRKRCRGIPGSGGNQADL